MCVYWELACSSCKDPVALTCWGPWLPLVQHTGPEVVRHPAAWQRKQGTETDRDGKTKNNRAVAEPHAAALVLQGTQPGSIAQAPNSVNVCSHAMWRVRVEGVGGGIAAASILQLWSCGWETDGEPAWLGLDGWPLATGLSWGGQWDRKWWCPPPWSATAC